MKSFKKISSKIFVLSFTGILLAGIVPAVPAHAAEDVITIRVCNWEE